MSATVISLASKKEMMSHQDQCDQMMKIQHAKGRLAHQIETLQKEMRILERREQMLFSDEIESLF